MSVDEVLLKMESFCAYRERCPKEVREKLSAFDLDTADAEKIYECLAGDRFFDEERFARAFVRGKFRINRWGKVRIRMELRRREISSETIRRAEEEIDPEEYASELTRMLAQKIKQFGNDRNGKDKSAAALIRAGFEPELVFRLIRENIR